MEEIEKEFKDLTQNQQEEAIEWFIKYQAETYVQDIAWYDFIWEDFVVNAKEKHLDVDSDSLSFDLDRNQLEFNGNVDEDHMLENASPRLQTYIDNEWIYDINTTFNDTELERDYNSDDVEDELRNELFDYPQLEGDTYKIETANVMVSQVKSVVSKYGLDESDFSEILGKISSSELFFQTAVEVTEDTMDDLINECGSTIYDSFDDEVLAVQEPVEEVLEELSDKLKEDLQGSYDYYFTEEFAKQELADMDFTILVDEDGTEELELDRSSSYY